MSAPGKPLYAGVDLGGTNINAALGDAAGKLLEEEKQPTLAHEGQDAVLARIASIVELMARRAGIRPLALGLGVPGLVDLDTGQTRFLPNLPTQWRNVPVAAILEEKLGCPVHLLNDARAAALGESMFGHGREARTMILFTLGTGVGGGIVIDGRLHLGPLGAAGEIGHICVQSDGPWCSCGSRGCLETFVSGPALTAEAVRLLASGNAPRLHEICSGDISRVSPETLGRAAEAGDPGALAAIERAGSFLGLAASGLVLALHPDIIVLGGGVSSLEAMLIPSMRSTIEAHVRMFPVDGVRIARSRLGERAGVLGGLAAAVQGGVTAKAGKNKGKRS
jgi:glucokinase